MINKLYNLYSTQKFSKIIHVSDIHIRLFKRHEEYRQVFGKLYQSITDWKLINSSVNAIIVVTGDVVHAKTDMSPEMVSMASKFFSSLADIFPTVVITGNHDMNLANPNRLDALTPIVTNLNHPQLHYLRDSGVYQLGNLGFGVYSIIGDKSDWPQASDIKAPVKIGLYHGPIINAKTDTGYTISGRSADISLFDGLDMVLLGDIHRYQQLQFYAPTMNKPSIAYAGSLIQQNHGETLHYHGWLEWDVDTKEHIFHEIVNDYGYATISVGSGKPLQIPDLPKIVRLRLLVDDLDSVGIKKVLAILRADRVISEVAINRISSAQVYDENSITKMLDVHDVQYQNKLIRTYLENYYPGISEGVLDKIDEINIQLNSKIKEDELPRNVHWRPIKLKFDNLFSYGEGNEVNFENMNGLYGVFSPNATGKTSAFDALCFALYDKTPRAFKGSHIMNTRADECYCELEFEVNGSFYKIIRKGSRRKNGEVKVDVEFLRMDNNEWVPLNGEDRRNTNSIIRSYVGDYEDFVLTNLSVQNQNSLFIDKGQTERKDLLSQFMGLTIFDRLYMLGSDESKEVHGSLKRFSKDDFTATLADVNNDLQDHVEEKNKLENQIENLKEEIEILTAAIAKKYEEKIPIEDENLDITELLKQKEQYFKKICDIDVNIKELKSQLSLIKMEMKTIVPFPYDIDELHNKNITLKSLSKEYEKKKSNIRVFNVKLSELKKKVDWLSTHEYDPNCRFCINNVFVKDAQEASKIYNEEVVKKEDLQKELNLLESQMNDYLEIPKLIFEYEKLSSQISTLDKKYLTKEVELQKLQTEILQQQNLLDVTSRSIEDYNVQKEAIETNKSINRDIELLGLKKKELMLNLEDVEEQHQNIHGQLQVLESKRDELLNKLRDAEELEATYEAYEHYLLAIGRDGIPYKLISEILPTVENSVNNILSQMVDFTLVLEVDGKNINGRIVYDDDRKWPLELASGMEKFITGLAIRVSLMSISNLPKSNFLIIDEGLSVLDSENLTSMFTLFNMLKNEFDFIILISHLDIVRDIADNLIEISRQDGYSHIIV